MLPIIEYANLIEAREVMKAVGDVEVIVKNSSAASQILGFDMMMAQMDALKLEQKVIERQVILCFDAGRDPIYAMEAALRGVSMVCFEGHEEVMAQIMPVFEREGVKIMPQSKKRIDFWGQDNIYSQCRDWLAN